MDAVDVGSSVTGRDLRASASVGANYRAANRGRSRPEFIAKLGIVEEEADESVYWIDLLVATECLKSDRIVDLRKEGIELVSMVVASINTSRRNQSRLPALLEGSLPNHHDR